MNRKKSSWEFEEAKFEKNVCQLMVFQCHGNHKLAGQNYFRFYPFSSTFQSMGQFFTTLMANETHGNVCHCRTVTMHCTRQNENFAQLYWFDYPITDWQTLTFHRRILRAFP